MSRIDDDKLNYEIRRISGSTVLNKPHFSYTGVLRPLWSLKTERENHFFRHGIPVVIPYDMVPLISMKCYNYYTYMSLRCLSPIVRLWLASVKNLKQCADVVRYTNAITLIETAAKRNWLHFILPSLKLNNSFSNDLYNYSCKG